VNGFLITKENPLRRSCWGFCEQVSRNVIANRNTMTLLLHVINEETRVVEKTVLLKYLKI